MCGSAFLSLPPPLLFLPRAEFVSLTERGNSLYVSPWRKRRQDFPHLSRKKVNALRCQRACSFVLCGFEFFLARCFGLRSLRIHDGVFAYMYIYTRYIYILGLFETFFDRCFCTCQKSFVTHVARFLVRLGSMVLVWLEISYDSAC